MLLCNILGKLVFLQNLNDNGKLVEKQGRKAKGPIKWQPATENKVFILFSAEQLIKRRIVI